MRTFALVSGLKINFAKSSFGAIGMSNRWKLDAASCLNCSLLSIPFVYLGIPIGANPRRGQLWDPILKKCERVLAKWKQRHLSFGGRVTLIQLVLTSIPIYFLCSFGIGLRCLDRISGRRSPINQVLKWVQRFWNFNRTFQHFHHNTHYRSCFWLILNT